uniref:Uncharacterized protein K02A2.6-like n=1 Tax=Saccoglossus kowalevskii TaxID=10224 RepID=A0ABM0M107_SACKO|nr:PREDICTED: uncharacterized protein K02A2.6-like [Saccoglossus kowalevskii]
MKARTVPFALRDKVDKEIDRLEKEGVIRPVSYSDWASPVVPVLKATGEVRICGDYKQTLNKALCVDRYPIPNVEDLYAKLAGGKFFTKLDLSHAYQQLLLDEESQNLTAINTNKGIYAYTRLPYGISAAPGIFQRTMEQTVQGISMTAVYIDDILVSGLTEKEHEENLDEVLDRLDKAGLKLKRDKCVFKKPSVTYLGHCIDATGIRPTEEKVAAIQKAPVPQNREELKSYLGLLNYYHRFLKNLSTVLAPLYQLGQQNTKWQWGKSQQEAFSKSKELLQSSQLLVHYDSGLKLTLDCDASPYGIGAVLSHRMPNGMEQPIAFASRTLAPAEKRYAQIEREGLAIVFGVTKFHKYLYGREFSIKTDHKPLLGLLKEDKAISQLASARIQRWALTLANYQYQLEYKPGSNMGNADGLSRLPIKEQPGSVPVPEEVVLTLSTLDGSPVTAELVANWTARDPVLSHILKWVTQGWPEQVEEQLRPYFRRKQELSVQQGCILWGSRVIIPARAREAILEELHEGHPGIVRMKALARNYLWWPGLDAEIDDRVRSCTACQDSTKSPTKAPLHAWEWPNQPWFRLHIDFAGPYEGKMILIIVDAHSKYIEAHVMPTATSTATINKLYQTFATHGLPHVIVSDNGTCFTSEEFRSFCKTNGIKHITTAPYHPASNGLAERAVQTVKGGLRKSSGCLESRLYRFLARYRITPQTTTGQIPAALLMHRHPRSRLDLVQPSLQTRVLHNQGKMKENYDTKTRDYTYFLGDSVFAMNYAGKPKWIPGVIEEKWGSLTFLVRLQDGRVWKRHQDQLRSRLPSEEITQSDQTQSKPNMVPVPIRMPSISPSVPVPKQDSSSLKPEELVENVSPPTTNKSTTLKDETTDPINEQSSETSASVPEVRRSSRQRKFPDKYDMYV